MEFIDLKAQYESFAQRQNSRRTGICATKIKKCKFLILKEIQKSHFCDFVALSNHGWLVQSSQYKRIEADVNHRIRKVLERGQYIMESEVFELEEKLAA